MRLMTCVIKVFSAAFDKVRRKFNGVPTCGNHQVLEETFEDFFREIKREVRITTGDSSSKWRTRVVNPEADQD